MKTTQKMLLGVGALALAGFTTVALSGVQADGWWSSWFGKPAAPAAQAAAAAPTPAMQEILQIQPTDRVLGSMTAPVTLVEYASMTCSHCADFANKTMPSVEKEWIATGKLKYVLRDLPWDDLAFGMAKVAGCDGGANYHKLAKVFFAEQMSVVTAEKPLERLKELAAPYGMDAAKVEQCVKEPTLHEQIVAGKQAALQGLQVKGTPALFINGVKHEGALDYKTLRPILEQAYAAAGK